ncbi:peptidoglycan recognition family protein [Clostridium sp. AM58-1XD]|uniref:peptidoglycan recognition protein family protein n=1 Tax=Clostridium sp. AM58-1XD TaxID=2292307 RepID=UPI000E51F056|nr:peptidoglycan recognition family protein [Clostridium sp. AM58-1XD]RGY98116.1 N-acetylmuramoyl-L-alanine amidase [Clostridium sp. AM58-1XD]
MTREEREKERRLRQIRARHAAMKKKRRRQRAFLRFCIYTLLLLILAAGVLAVRLILWRPHIDGSSIEIPAWIDVQLIDPNPFSRPQTPLEEVKGIVVHYTANPGTSAQKNRNFFNNLAKQDPNGKTTSVSSHFVIGLDGEIIQCVPLTEIAYASNNRNIDTISIECCHPDESGKFTAETYQSLVRLTAWLKSEFHLKKNDIIRHYDVKGKPCPLYFVEHEDAWKQFKKDVDVYKEEH